MPAFKANLNWWLRFVSTSTNKASSVAWLVFFPPQAPGYGFVHDGNSARHLYEHAGFDVVSRNGESDTMLLKLGTRDGSGVRSRTRRVV